MGHWRCGSKTVVTRGSGHCGRSPASATSFAPHGRLNAGGQALGAPSRCYVTPPGADELLVTTVAHDLADRVRSFELMAKHGKARRAGRASDSLAAGAGQK